MKRKTKNALQLNSFICHLIFIVVLLFVLGNALGCKTSRSPLLEDSTIPRPCSYMLEYWYSSQRGEKSLSTWLATWCREAEKKRDIVCKKKCSEVEQ